MKQPIYSLLSEASVSWSISYYSGSNCYHWTTGVVVDDNSFILGYLVGVVKIVQA